MRTCKAVGCNNAVRENFVQQGLGTDFCDKCVEELSNIAIQRSSVESPNNQTVESGEDLKGIHDVSNLYQLDVFRVLRIFDVTDPCIQAVVHQLLKPSRVLQEKQVTAAIEKLERWQEMKQEDHFMSSRGNFVHA